MPHSEITVNRVFLCSFLDNDKGEVATLVRQGLQGSGVFHTTDSLGGKAVTEAELRESIRKGEYQLGIIIPEGTTDFMQGKVSGLVDQTLSGLVPGDTSKKEIVAVADTLMIALVVDPTAKSAFRTSIRSAIGQFLEKVESDMLVRTFARELEKMTGAKKEIALTGGPVITIKESLAAKTELEGKVAANSVQHNVPAWTIFAMFFIVIPMASNMLREKDSGTMQRLRVMQGSLLHYFGGKMLAYLLVCAVQLVLMMLVGKYLLPLLGLDALSLGAAPLGACACCALAVSVAAISYGMLVGASFRTHQQALVFGIVSVVIMAALGGIWVPIQIMPETMQLIGHLSPLSWAFDAFNVIFLRGGGLSELVPHIIPLAIFSLACLALAVLMMGRRLR
jgi:ABC-2 type transport system permease protein